MCSARTKDSINPRCCTRRRVVMREKVEPRLYFPDVVRGVCGGLGTLRTDAELVLVKGLDHMEEG
ncbi:hypothetical protein ACPPVU_12570 [Mucilaginibacter sp. McL0603]|uniref:hypothetical protein n=1 Tax=Mucilaginibacter sp. McL0603 TaxID=3415670 RepID=UPI003CF473CB